MSTSPAAGPDDTRPDDSWLTTDPAWAGVRQEVIDVDGRPVRVLRADATGDGAAPQLLVHGLGGSAANWIDVIAPLAARGPVVAVDLPGFGHTRIVDSDRLTVPGHVSFVRHVVDALGWERATVHGNSMGGLVATHLAARHPDVVERLVLVSPALPPSCALRLLPPSVPAVQGMLTMGVPSIGGTVLAAATGRDVRPARALLGLIFTDPDAVRPTLLQAMAADALSGDPDQLADRRLALRASTASIARLWLEPGPTWRAIRAVTAPTLVLGGTADALVPARVLRHVLAARPDWRGELITDRRHALMLSEPHEFLAHVEDWLTTHRRAA
ncbi:alpha/beta hydrolase [Nocardioides marinus]|uniref:Pimeloyl-ACP methyl ester carboxylesterase n=1 Tax=Nocardioides marinus TaxID=374514 RepID=A0A7Y9YCR9_9ACTN|nr:alpha/beta hydrolase [Nocardioides marinus]NYI09828.1 pimeloyl-ACP methyl ester carboxylesterase [Nocardioides marinus]